jgi:hypothetical protein
MPSTYTLIKGETLASSAASYTFTAIPSTFTDLVLRISERQTAAGLTNFTNFTYNSSGGTAYSRTYINGTGSAATSGSNSNQAFLRYYTNGDDTTANTFNSTEIYIPNYTVSQNKPCSIFAPTETNAVAIEMQVVAGLWRDTTAISSIQITPVSGNLAAGSSYYLYGIKNS